jgi:hypothetical protein
MLSGDKFYTLDALKGRTNENVAGAAFSVRDVDFIEPRNKAHRPRLLQSTDAPWFKRHRDNPQLKAFVDGATAAATGAITGAVIVLGLRAITDIPTAIIALVSFAVLWRFKISEPIIVTISGVIGLILWPLVRAG